LLYRYRAGSQSIPMQCQRGRPRGSGSDYVHTIAHEFGQPIAVGMDSTPALGHLHILGIAAAKQHHQLGVACD